MIVGNDISKFQGQIDFGVLKNHANFIIAKATEGVGYIDGMFGYNRSQARLAGIPFGSYAFARPDLGNSPEAEAEFYCNVLDGDPIREGEIVCLDYECANQKQADVDWCLRWLNYVKNHYEGNIKPFIYLNQAQVAQFDWSAVVNAGYPLWLASYQADGVGNAGEFKTFPMQQWTSSQQVPSISGNVDGDHFFGDVNDFKSYGYKKPTPPPPPPTPPQPPTTDPVPPTPPTPTPTTPPSVPPPVTPSDPCSLYKQKLTDINVIASKFHWFYGSDWKKIQAIIKL